MDDRKVVQVLKEIFDHCGVEIVGKEGKFRSAVLDLLNEWEDKEERIVLRNAIESGALLPFASDKPITADTAEKVAGQLMKAGHMTEEDAEFVVRCFVAARGGQRGGQDKKSNAAAAGSGAYDDSGKGQVIVQGGKQEAPQDGKPSLKEKIAAMSRGKRIVLAIFFGLLLWAAAIGIFCLADEMDFQYIPVCTAVIAVCALGWMWRIWKVPQKLVSTIFVTLISGLAWGAAGFLFFGVIVHGIHDYYYGDDYRQAYTDFLDYRLEYYQAQGNDDVNSILRETHAIIWDRNNGSFYYNGHRYGLTFGKEQLLFWIDAAVVCVLICGMQSIVLILTGKRKKQTV